MKRFVATILAALMFSHIAVALDPAHAKVEGQGELSGAVAGAVVSFKNIPYAAPPVGDLRWRAPQPPAAWEGVRDASAFGPACMQIYPGMALNGESEDCLSLNVWAPVERPAEGLPVIVWIHGGAFKVGTGATTRYDGTPYAERGVVVVTINYRLGWLGFFAHPALKNDGDEARGNYGIMDQIAALKWVQAHIAAFGGDPKRVTIMGESAGGISVHLLMTMPAARGLFSSAIAMSGFPRNELQHISRAESAEIDAQKFASDNKITGDGADAAAALRALPSSAFQTSPDNPLGPPRVMLDDTLVISNPMAIYEKGEQARVPLVTGGTSWEASLMPVLTANPAWLASRIAKAEKDAGKLYGFETDPATAAADFITDYYETEPDRAVARLHAKAGSPTFLYHFSYLPEAQRSSLPGVPHGMDTLYTFGWFPPVAFDFMGVTYLPETPPDREMSNHLIDCLAQFAKTGAPSEVGGIMWSGVNETAAPFLVFGTDGLSLAPDFAKERLDAVEKLRGVPGWHPW